MAALAAGVLVGCSTAGGFALDDHVRIDRPRDLQTVALPLRLSWQTHDLPPGFARFAVLVDRLPLSPGRTVRSLADAACKRRPGCPDDTYLRQLNVYVTADNFVSIPTVPLVPGVTGRAAHPVHRATVFLLDRQGRRVGGSADTVTFRVRGG